MARRVFFSFHHENDVFRANVARNSGMIRGIEKAGFIDHAEFEKVKRRGNRAVYDWIDDQLNGTTVTVVLIGKETLNREFVQYEICKSLERNNGIIGVHINGIMDQWHRTSERGNVHTIVGHYSNGRDVYFDEIADGIYSYTLNDGYNNMGKWIEAAVANRKRLAGVK